MRRTRRGRGFGPLVLGLGLAVLLCGGGPAARAQESWDAIFMAGAKVGFVHTFVAPVKDRGRDLLRVRQDMEFNFKRNQDNVTIKTMYGTIETLDGSVLKLETRTLASNQQMTASGQVVNGQMTLTLEGSGQNQRVTFPWGPDVRGPYAPEMSMVRSPMKPGESRTVRMYVPDLNKICDATLTAKENEEVTLGAGKQSLLRVDETVMLDGKPQREFNITFWVDANGSVLRAHSEIMGGLDFYRTTRDGAQQGLERAALDLTGTSIIKVTHKLAKPETTRDITYRVGLKDDDPATVLPSDRRQTVKSSPSANQNQAILEVRTAGPKAGAAGPETVDDEFLRANALVTSRDEKVRRFAFQAIAGAIDPWEKATKITHWVSQNVKEKNFRTAFAPASEVAQTLAGDCTEHGVLVAAMCRAVNVPARVAVGLVYSGDHGGFGYHLWNEVYVNRRWVAVDAAFDQTEVDAAHIKLADTSLDGVSPYQAFLPVARVMNRMTLEPIEIR